MFNRRSFLPTLLCAALAVACAPSAVSPSEGGSDQPPARSGAVPSLTSDPTLAATPSPGAPVQPTAVTTPTLSPTRPVSPTPADTATILGPGEQVLDAGTYRIVGHPDLPSVVISVPAGWQNFDGWAVRLVHPGAEVAAVAVQFWDVQEIYGHPCQWRGTLFRPGPTVDDLAAALAEVPLRDATDPVDVVIDGYAGKYVAWSVPADMDFGECDTDGGEPYFQSWTGDVWASGRYQQSPGQVDRLWIIDVDGSRLVIDAFEMPAATAQERDELAAVVRSIRFDR